MKSLLHITSWFLVKQNLKGIFYFDPVSIRYAPALESNQNMPGHVYIYIHIYICMYAYYVYIYIETGPSGNRGSSSSGSTAAAAAAAAMTTTPATMRTTTTAVYTKRETAIFIASIILSTANSSIICPQSAIFRHAH